MTAATAKYIRHVLELHYQYSTDQSRSKKERDAEKAYLQGLYDMLQLIGTEAYTISGKSCNDILTEAEEEMK